MNLFRLKIVTPHNILFEDDIEFAILPSEKGYFEILHGHTPLVAIMATGTVTIMGKDNKRRLLAVSNPYIDIANNKCVLFADTAEFAENIDIARAKTKISEHERNLNGAQDVNTIMNSILKHKVRIKTVEDYLARRG